MNEKIVLLRIILHITLILSLKTTLECTVGNDLQEKWGQRSNYVENLAWKH